MTKKLAIFYSGMKYYNIHYSYKNKNNNKLSMKKEIINYLNAYIHHLDQSLTSRTAKISVSDIYDKVKIKLRCIEIIANIIKK